MKNLITIGASLALALTVPASNVVIDDFGGGPHTVSLTSLAPPEIALGSFAYGGAIGGIRDAAVWSTTVGQFSAGVAFNSGGYASFAGRGQGGVAWDGVAGIADANADNTITPNELDYGLALDLSACETGRIEVSAFTDLTTAVLRIAIGTDALNYNQYDIALNQPVNQFNDYSIALGSPTATIGTVDWSNVGAVALFVDASNFDNLDVLVNRLVIACPDGGGTLALLGLGLLGLATVARRK